MKTFTDLYAALDQTTKTSEKVNAMALYFSGTDPADSIWAVALLTGRRPKRPMKTNLLRSWATELAGIPDWLFDESYAVVGDLAETISLLIPTQNNDSSVSLDKVMSAVIEVYQKTEPEKKEWLLGFWGELSRAELFVFNKLITGAFRVGVSAQLVYKALAKAFDIDEKTVAHRLTGNWTPQEITLKDLLLDPEHSSDHSKPYPFYLAYQLDVPLTDLGSPEEWQIEKKFDGIRGQIVVRNQEVFVWSRGEELMTEKFPEFDHLKNTLPSGTVLDGEILPVKNGKILSFSEMQKRTGRKNPGKKILNDVPLCMMCYDLLEANGEDIRQKPLSHRRKMLEELLISAGSSNLLLSPLQQFGRWEELNELRQKSRLEGCEGLMLKRVDGVYETGRRRGKWWKWKTDPYTVDAVLLYAQPGHGRRANLYTDYTFGIRDNNELLPFAKAYSGLSDREIIEVDQWIKRNTIEKFGPVRSVKAELVFEIAFEGINVSSRHKSGIALRFPRISRWRRDKKVEEINTKNDLIQLLNVV